MASTTKKKELILQLIDESKKGFDLYRDYFSYLEQGFLNILPREVQEELKRKKKSLILPKIIRAKVRRVVISVMKTYFENDELATLAPIYDSEIVDTKKLQEALNHWTSRRINLYTRLKPAIYDALIYGFCAAKIYWSGGMRVQRVKIKDIWVDPNAESIFDIQYAVNRVYTTIGKLKKQYGNKKVFQNYIGSYDGDAKVSNEFVGDATRILVYDVYRFEGGKWRVSTILPDDTFLRVDHELKDGLPFAFGIVDPQFVPIDNSGVVEAYGESVVEPMIPLQDEYTALRNKQLEAIDKQLMPQFLATKMSGLKEADLNSNKKKIEVSDLSMVKELPQPNINQSIFNVEKLDQEMQEVSGITKFTQGLASGASQTATGMTILTQESNEIIADIIRSLNESFFEPLISRMVRLIYKYDENPLLYGVDRSKDIKFKVVINAGVGATNREVLLNNITTAEQTAMQMVSVAANLGDVQGARRYLEVLNELYAKKLAAIGFKGIAHQFKGGESGQDGSGGDTEEPGADEIQQSMGVLPAGAEGTAQQPLPSGDGYEQE